MDNNNRNRRRGKPRNFRPQEPPRLDLDRVKPPIVTYQVTLNPFERERATALADHAIQHGLRFNVPAYVLMRQIAARPIPLRIRMEVLARIANWEAQYNEQSRLEGGEANDR